MPPKAKRKYVPDVGWDEKLKGYVVRVLVQKNHDGTAYEAWSKDLEGVNQGYGTTEKDAMQMVKKHLKEKLTKLRDTNDGKMPFTEISCVRTFGARVVFCLIQLEKPAKQESKFKPLDEPEKVNAG